MSEQKYLELNPNNIQYEGYEQDKARFISIDRYFEANPNIEIPGMRQEYEALKEKISKNSKVNRNQEMIGFLHTFTTGLNFDSLEDVKNKLMEIDKFDENTIPNVTMTEKELETLKTTCRDGLYNYPSVQNLISQLAAKKQSFYSGIVSNSEMKQQYNELINELKFGIKTESPKVEILETKVEETELSTQEKALLEELTNLKKQRDDLEKKINLAEINPEDCYYAEINQDRLKLDELNQKIDNHSISIKNKEKLEQENLKNKEKLEQENFEKQYNELVERVSHAEKIGFIYPELKQDKMKLTELEQKITDYREKIEKEQYTNLSNQIVELKKKINLAELNPEDCFYSEIEQDKIKLAELERAEEASPHYVKIDEKAPVLASLSAEEIALVNDFIEDFTSGFIITNKADYVKACNFLIDFNANTIPNLTLSNEKTIEIRDMLHAIISDNSLYRAFYAQDFAEKAASSILNYNQNAELDTLYKLVDTISINNLKEIKVTEKELFGIKEKIKEDIKNKKNSQPNPLDTEKEIQIANFINGFKNGLVINSQEDIYGVLEFSENIQENSITGITLTPEELVSVKKKLLDIIFALPGASKLIDDRVTPTKKESKKIKAIKKALNPKNILSKINDLLLLDSKKALVELGFAVYKNPTKAAETEKKETMLAPSIKSKGFQIFKPDIQWNVDGINEKTEKKSSKKETEIRNPDEFEQKILNSLNLPSITLKVFDDGGKVVLKNPQTSEIKYARDLIDLERFEKDGFSYESIALNIASEEELAPGLLENGYSLNLDGITITNLEEYRQLVEKRRELQKEELYRARNGYTDESEKKEDSLFQRFFRKKEKIEWATIAKLANEELNISPEDDEPVVRR